MEPTQILRDRKMQDTLNAEGIVQMPFAGPEVVKQLIEFSDELNKGRSLPQDTLHTYLKTTDKELVTEMNKGLREILKPLMDKVLVDYRYTSFTYQSKGLGDNSLLSAHQDWSFSDETKYRTYTFWLTLMDSVPGNGTLHVIKRSHKKLNNIRGAGIDPVCKNVWPEAAASMEPIYAKAGDLLIFDSALLHYSPPNTTQQIRVSVMTNLVNKDADFMMYFGRVVDNDIYADAYKVADSFLVEYDDITTQFFSPPKSAVFLNSTPIPDASFTKESFADFLKDIKSDDKWYNKLKKMLTA